MEFYVIKDRSFCDIFVMFKQVGNLNIYCSENYIGDDDNNGTDDGKSMSSYFYAELLSQLSSARSRAAAAQSISSQLHQLEVQLQSSRYVLQSCVASTSAMVGYYKDAC